MSKSDNVAGDSQHAGASGREVVSRDVVSEVVVSEVVVSRDLASGEIVSEIVVRTDVVSRDIVGREVLRSDVPNADVDAHAPTELPSAVESRGTRRSAPSTQPISVRVPTPARPQPDEPGVAPVGRARQVTTQNTLPRHNTAKQVAPETVPTTRHDRRVNETAAHDRAVQHPKAGQGRFGTAAIAWSTLWIVMWPALYGMLVRMFVDPQKYCSTRRPEEFTGTGEGSAFLFLPPRTVCALDASGSGGFTIAPLASTLMFLALLIGAVVLIVLGFRNYVRSIEPLPNETRVSYRIRQYEHGALLGTVVSLISPVWMFYLKYGLNESGGIMAAPREQIYYFENQIIVAAMIPLVACGAGIITRLIGGDRVRLPLKKAVFGIVATGVLFFATLVVGLADLG